MAEILPFRALHYHPARVRLRDVVTQPYDKITPEMQARYYAASPYNLARIIRRRPAAREENPHAAASRDFQEWIREGILASGDAPALFAYDQEYTPPGGDSRARTRRGFIALLKLEDYSAGVVYRHEETFSAIKADRLALLAATRAHFGQIFLLYSDAAGVLERALAGAREGEAWERVEDEYHTVHSVWRVSDDAIVGAVIAAMREKSLIIADGHHRYETALAYRDQRRARARERGGANDEAAEYVMATFVAVESAGLTILPTHRVIHGLAGFDWERFVSALNPWFEHRAAPVRPEAASRDLGGVEAELARAGQNRPALLAYAGRGRVALLELRAEADLGRLLPDLPPSLARLDVVVLHRLLLVRALGVDPQALREARNVRYVREAAEALGQVDRGEAQLCFLLNPTPIEAVRENALAGLPLPQKSTDFYPKLLSGLTMYRLDEARGR